MVRLLASSLFAVGLVSAAEMSPCQGGNETCGAMAGGLDEAEDQLSAIQISRHGQNSGELFRKCPSQVLKCQTVQSIVDAVESEGALAHAFTVDKDGFDRIIADGGIKDFSKHGVLTDCSPKSCPTGVAGSMANCSAWSLIKTGFVPMVYNYPTDFYSMHGVGFLVKNSQSMQRLITRRTVVDSDTCDRSDAGMFVKQGYSVVSDWNTRCPGWLNTTNQKVEDTGVVCVTKSITGQTYACNSKATPPVFEVQVGTHGQDWPKIFLYNSQGKAEFTFANTMAPQCAFQDQSLYENALKAFYSEMGRLTVTPFNGIGYPYPDYHRVPDISYYLETELNMQTPAGPLLQKMQPNLLAITVQLTKCVDSMGFLRKSSPREPKAFCSAVEKETKEKEDVAIGKSLQVACMVQRQMSKMMKRHVPVVDAKFLTGSMTQTAWMEYATAKVCECNKFCEIDCSKVAE